MFLAGKSSQEYPANASVLKASFFVYTFHRNILIYGLV